METVFKAHVFSLQVPGLSVNFHQHRSVVKCVVILIYQWGTEAEENSLLHLILKGYDRTRTEPEFPDTGRKL